MCLTYVASYLGEMLRRRSYLTFDVYVEGTYARWVHAIPLDCDILRNGADGQEKGGKEILVSSKSVGSWQMLT